MIPYYITIARPDYKRPSMAIYNGVCDDEIICQDNKKLKEFLLNQLIDNFLQYSSRYYNNYEQIINTYYMDGYMSNEPFECYYFTENNWCILKYTDDEFMKLYNYLLDNGTY